MSSDGTGSHRDHVLRTRDPFALPRGPLGRLTGRMMARSNRAQQREVLELLPSSGRILEVGFGPGVLVELALARSPSLIVAGVDPSPVMVQEAQARNAGAAGRADLREGAAASIPFEDRSFDAVVSVNNVRLWPDQRLALAELARVVRPGGTVVIGSHGGRRATWLQRRLSLPADDAAAIETALSATFGSAERRELDHLTVFVATAP